MKCARCGAEICKGNLYCSKCGAEVQIVSADNVMEEEFFLDFQKREMRSTMSEEDSHAATHDGNKKKQKRQNLLGGWLTAVLGACVLIIVPALLFAPDAKAAGNTSGTDASYDSSDDDAYENMIRALAAGEDEQAARLLKDHRVMQDDPTAEKFWQAWLYGQQSDAKQQIRTLQEILAGDEENVYACRELIRIYVTQGDFDALYDFYQVYENSALAGLFADYLVAAPQIELPSEPVFEGDRFTISAQDGLNVYYTLDGSSPVTNGTLYYAPLQPQAGEYTISAVACNEEGYYSPVVTASVKVTEHYQLGMPQVTPGSGEYQTPQTIHISVPAGCSAYYTWSGQNPTTASTRYQGGISMPEGNNVLSVIIVDAYGNESSIQRMNYIYMP